MEIRNVTSTLRNNTSFGMALKVKLDDVQGFTKYLKSSGYKESLVQKGLKQIIKEQNSNKHFDIMYEDRGGFFRIEPKTEFAKEVFPGVAYTDETSGTLNSIELKSQDLNEYLNSSKPNTFGKIKHICGYLKEFLKASLYNQKEFLPAQLRAAAKTATSMNQQVEAFEKSSSKVQRILQDNDSLISF